MNISDKDSEATLGVQVRPTVRDDLEALYLIQREERGNAMAVANPRTRSEFEAHWHSVLEGTDAQAYTIMVNEHVAGSVSCFTYNEENCVGYWISERFWDRGIATVALQRLLEEVNTRPLYAYVASTNFASIRVLKKCGFAAIGTRESEATPRFPACIETRLILNEK